MVSSLMRTSPSGLTFSDAEKYDMTSLRPGSVEGMKRRKSLLTESLGVVCCLRVGLAIWMKSYHTSILRS